MNCKNCNGELTKKQKAFCSTECKGEWQVKQPKETFDESTQFRCKIDGKLFDRNAIRSGNLKKYSKNILKKEYNELDWEIIDKIKEDVPKWSCPHCDWSCKCSDGKDSSGWIGVHLQKIHQIDKLQHIKDFPKDNLLWSHSIKKLERENKINESEENRIQCLECGEFMISISNSHLKHKHGMTKNEYRKKHDIQILSSQEYRKRLSIQYHNNDNLQNSSNWRSKYEDELCNLMEELNVEFIPNHKKFGFDLDLYLPNNNLAIEFNGLYFHSQYAGGKTEFYHVNKTKKCEELGIHLIHIFEDEWINKREIVISRIKNQLGKTENILYARKCEIKVIDYHIASKFLDENHIQGKTTNARVNLGLFNDDVLVSLMTFGLPRNSTGNKNKLENEWELQRFCNKINYSVVGGASRLLNYFEKNYKISKITSFADRRWTSTLKDSLYDELGFTLTSLGSPNYWYLVEPMKRTHRFTFTKKNILDKFSKSKPELSEWENMIELGFDRIWDCGSLKYEKVYDESNLDVDLSEKIESANIRQVKRRRKKKETTRNIIDIECKICFNSYSIVGIHNHFNLNHDLTVEEYVEKYGEYRPEKLKFLKMLEIAGDKYKCKICGEICRNDVHLTKHLKTVHELEKIDYIFEKVLNSKIPKCKCGCGNEVKLITSFPYLREFISGHNPNGMIGKKHSKESREKMSKPRTKWSKK